MSPEQSSVVCSRVRPGTSFDAAHSSFVLAFALCAFLAVACGASDVASKRAELERCSLNSDCNEGLICALGSCRIPCTQARDCGNGGSCVTDGVSAACQSLSEKDTMCNRTRDCPTPLACASDYRCRNLCDTDADCNELGVSGRSCAEDERGVRYCAEPDEVDDQGNLVATPLTGAMVGDDLDGGGRDAGAGDASTSNTSPDGGELTSACLETCGEGMQCVEGACAACGAQDDACCGTSCSAGLSCTAGKCSCGTPGAACCAGDQCSGGVACVAGMCACGSAAGQTCCPGEAATSCGAALVCMPSNKCGCITAVTTNLVLRSDGTVWSYAPLAPNQALPTQIIAEGGAALHATAIAEGYGFGCAVATNGEVWCWNFNGYANASGQLGNSTSTPSTTPTRVLTATGGSAPLTDIASISAGYASTCAVNKQGAVWCWGNGNDGVLGTGFTGNSVYAAPVLTRSGGGPLADVEKVAVEYFHVCQAA